jgi:tetratricopeptide (TPR) repeat protein
MATNSWGNWSTFDAGALARLAPLAILAGTLGLLYFWPKPSPAELSARAEAAISAGNLPLAYSSLRQAILAEPYSFDHHLKLAEVLTQANNFDQAISELSIAQELNPSSDLSTELDRLRQRAAEPAALQTELAEVAATLAAHPDYRDGWVRAAYLHYRLRQDQDAKKALARALEIDPNYNLALKLQALLP